MVGPRLTLFVCLFVPFRERKDVNVFVFIVTFVGPMVGPRLTLAPPRRWRQRIATHSHRTLKRISLKDICEQNKQADISQRYLHWHWHSNIILEWFEFHLKGNIGDQFEIGIADEIFLCWILERCNNISHLGLFLELHFHAWPPWPLVCEARGRILPAYDNSLCCQILIVSAADSVATTNKFNFGKTNTNTKTKTNTQLSVAKFW